MHKNLEEEGFPLTMSQALLYSTAETLFLIKKMGQNVPPFPSSMLKLLFQSYICYIIANNMSHKDETLSPFMAVVGMVNGMIGGLILILPVLALNAGYVLTFIVIAVTGCFSLYTCYLCVIHMGDQPDLDRAILRHFNGNKAVKIFYDLCVWSNLLLIDMLYFELIQMQWDGLIAQQQYPVLNPVTNAIVLFCLVFFLKYVDLGASVMAFGIISIASYLLFLIWVVSTSDQGNTSVQYNAFGSGAVNMAAAMGQAFAIQSFFIPVLKKTANPSKYVLLTTLAYIVGGFAYFYIAYMGSFGIWHRYLAAGYDPQNITIESYFGQSAWEVKIIESIYLVHLYSVFPEFMLISKKRFFGVIGVEESHAGRVSIPEVIYIALAVGICFLIGILDVSITDIIDINGAVVGFFFIYFLPAMLHVKCMYFSKGKLPLPQVLPLPSSEQTQQALPQERKRTHRQSEIQILGTPAISGKLQEPLLSSEPETKVQIQLSAQQIENSFYYCDCGKDPSWKKYHWINIILIVIMLLMGAFIMVNGIYAVAT